MVQILESLERATSKIVPLAEEFSKPLIVKARDNGGGYIEGEKGKILIQGFKKNRKEKRISCA